MYKCEYCEKAFKLKRKNSIGRFCSSICNRKVLRKNQIKKKQEFLAIESDDDRLKRLRSRYEKYLIKKDGCWDWSATKSSGYGVMMFDGKPMKAHRISWELYYGKIPEKMFILHKCDVRECSNPEHLFLGDNKINMQDMAQKGRAGVRFGTNHKHAKLNEYMIIEIKKRLKIGVTASKIAKDYKVNSNTIYSIKKGKTWSWVKVDDLNDLS